MTDRIVALVDMDCFYVQVEQRLNPSLVGKPCAVVQYNEWRGGGIIAVSYEARDRGVSRHARGDDAKRVCQDIELVRVPELNGKADLTRYRNAGQEVIEVLGSFARCVERASVDEAYIDLTEEVRTALASAPDNSVHADQLPLTYVEGYGPPESGDSEADRKMGLETWLNRLQRDGTLEEPLANDDLRLAVGASIVSRMRQAVFDKTGFRCSAGIAHNKMLSKLACGLHKPNRQTILPQSSVAALFQNMPLNKVRNLGGKLGKTLMEELACETMGDLAACAVERLQKHFGDKTGAWLHDLGRGLDGEPVKSRHLPQSIGCSKNFPGKNALTTQSQVKMWLTRLATELEGRLTTDRDTNNRIAKSLSVYTLQEGSAAGVSRSCSIAAYNVERIAESCYAVLEKLNMSPANDSWSPPLLALGMAAGKFQEFDGTSTTLLENFFIRTPRESGTADVTAATPSASSSAIEEEPDRNPIDENRSVIAGVASKTSTPQKQVGFFASRLKQMNANTTTESKPAETKDPQGNSRASASTTSAIGTRPKAPPPFSAWTKSKASTSNKPATYQKEPLTLESIDPEVLDSLPLDIRDEIQSHLNSAGKPEVSQTKPVSGIAKFFTVLQPSGSRVAPGGADSTKGAGNPIVSASADSRTSGNPISSGSAESTPHESATEAVDRPPTNTGDIIICDKCNKEILVWDFPEHADYHVAVELQKEVSASLARSETSDGPARHSKLIKKRKGRQPKAGTTKTKKARSISSFFNHPVRPVPPNS